MARRLLPTERRQEIIERTYELIATEGPQGLSLRSVARACGMSAPGLMHHFPSLGLLLREVIARREEIENAEIARIVRAAGDELTLEMLADHLIRYYASKPVDTRNFDILEADSFSPDHPLHGGYERSVIQPLPVTRMLAERDYDDPEAVLTVIAVVADGLRIRWLRDPENADWLGEWETVREAMFGLIDRASSRRRTTRSSEGRSIPRAVDSAGTTAAPSDGTGSAPSESS